MTLLLLLVIVTALGFEFTNGFHDTANAMATSIATGALKPRVAVLLSGVLNLVGAFLSLQVALTVTNSVHLRDALDRVRVYLAEHGWPTAFPYDDGLDVRHPGEVLQLERAHGSARSPWSSRNGA